MRFCSFLFFLSAASLSVVVSCVNRSSQTAAVADVSFPLHLVSVEAWTCIDSNRGRGTSPLFYAVGACSSFALLSPARFPLSLEFLIHLSYLQLGKMYACLLSVCVCVCLYVLPTFHLPEILILPHEHNPHFSECQINWGRLSCPKNSIQNRSPVLHLLKKKVILEQSWGLGFSAWLLRIEQHCHKMLTIVTEAVCLQSCSCRLSISLECASPIVQLFESCHLLPGMQQGLGFCRTEFLLYQQTGTFFMIYVHTFELSVCVLGFMAIAWLKRSCKWCGKPREIVTVK